MYSATDPLRAEVKKFLCACLELANLLPRQKRLTRHSHR